jgi:hypothetical protein
MKNLTLWSLLICCGLLAAYVLFLGGISIWVGLSHLQQAGFWMPITTGTITLLGVLWVFLRLTRFILNRMKEKGFIEL